MRLLRFILSHSIFVSLCAVALSVQTVVLLGLEHITSVYALVFCSTLAAYNFYWLVSKYRFAASRKNFLITNPSFLLLFLAAGMATVYLLWLQPAIIPVLVPGIALTILYSVPLWPVKEQFIFNALGFIKPVLLALAWTYITTFLPAAAYTPRFELLIQFIARFCFMFLLCAIFDLRDQHVDKIRGLASLASAMSARALRRLIVLVFIVFFISGCLLRVLPFQPAQLIAFLAFAATVWFVYRRSEKPQGYIFYYFIVDGLMLLSGILTVSAAMV